MGFLRFCRMVTFPEMIYVVPSMSRLTPTEVDRYDRHLLLPEVREEGQLRLKNSKVLVIGVGGLGAPISLYLAAAGIGKLGIMDFDSVDPSNLQRQVLFDSTDVGRSKIQAAKERLEKLNPLIEVVPHVMEFGAEGSLDLVHQYDIVIDGTDNFPTRYLINDACVLSSKPLVYGSVFRFEGQVSVFGAKGGACYRCLYPELPSLDLIPNCAEAGVFGVLPGMIGSIQANEAIKLILGIGKSLQGRLLVLDALTMRFREFEIRRNPHCAVCGDSPVIHELQVSPNRIYSSAGNQCAAGVSRPKTHASNLDGVAEMTPVEFKRKIDSGEELLILDVRNRHEYEKSNLANLGGTLIPLEDVPHGMGQMEKNRKILVHCATGRRSRLAALILQEAGFSQVWSLQGGIVAWEALMGMKHE